MQDRGFYTVEQAADTLDLTPGRIRQMLRAGDLEGIPPEESGARGWRIPAAVVEERRRNAPRKEQAPPGDPHAAELVEVLREQVEDLRARLDREQEANRENRRLLAAALERIPELEAPREPSEAEEPRESPESTGPTRIPRRGRTESKLGSPGFGRLPQADGCRGSGRGQC